MAATCELDHKTLGGINGKHGFKKFEPTTIIHAKPLYWIKMGLTPNYVLQASAFCSMLS